MRKCVNFQRCNMICIDAQKIDYILRAHGFVNKQHGKAY